MKIIAIATDCRPINALGGPGRFAPALFTILHGNKNIDTSFVGLFCGQLAHDPRQIQYSNSVNRRSLVSQLRVQCATRTPRSFIALSKLKRRALSISYMNKLYLSNVDIVHAHDFGVVERLERFHGKIILTNHYKGSVYKEAGRFEPGLNHPSWARRLVSLERDAIQRADFITFPSHSAKRLLIDDFPNLSSEIERKCEVIYSGIDSAEIDAIQNSSPNDNTFLNVGNHIPDKGVDVAIRVFSKLYQYDKTATFINVGQAGVDTEKLVRLTEKLNIAQSVKFLGVIPFVKVIKLMKRANALIHTPKRVVFDLTLLEAMAARVPIIASGVEGNREALGPEHPLIIREIEKFSAEDVLQLLRDQTSRGALIYAQRERFEEFFTIEKMARHYQNLYGSI